jgi:hypothetical protein
MYSITPQLRNEIVRLIPSNVGDIKELDHTRFIKNIVNVATSRSIVWNFKEIDPFTTTNHHNETIMNTWTIATSSLLSMIDMLNAKNRSKFPKMSELAINCFAWCEQLGFDQSHQNFDRIKPLMFLSYPSRGFVYLSKAIVFILTLMKRSEETKPDYAIRLSSLYDVIVHMELANQIFKNLNGQSDIGHNFLMAMANQINIYKDIYLFFSVIHHHFNTFQIQKSVQEKTIENLVYIIYNKLKRHKLAYNFWKHVEIIKNTNIKKDIIDANEPSFIYTFIFGHPLQLNLTTIDDMNKARNLELDRFSYLNIVFTPLIIQNHDPTDFILSLLY